MRRTLTGLCAVLLWGCASAPQRSIALHPQVHSLRSAHGGEARWHGHSGVRFLYQVRQPGRFGWIPVEIGVRPGNFDFLWLEGEGSGEMVRVPLRPVPGEVARQLERLPDTLTKRDTEAVDFALRSIHLLLTLPLATAQGSWEYRFLLQPPGADLPQQVEVVPGSVGSPIGPCLLEPDPQTGLLSRIVYGGRHPFVARGAYEVVFDRYITVNGLLFASRRRHYLTGSTADPITGEARRPVLEEEISHIEFLDNSEADRRLPLPEEEATEDEATVQEATEEARA